MKFLGLASTENVLLTFSLVGIFPNPIKERNNSFMRTRNIKINVFLNEEEKQMLVKKSNIAKMSQSDFFRMLIQDYSVDRILNKDLVEIVDNLNVVSNNLSKLSSELNRLYYCDYTRFLNEQITSISKAIQKINYRS